MGLPAVAKQGEHPPRERGRPELSLGAEPPAARSRIKRTLDFLGAAILLALTAPLFLLIGAAIRLDSRGPVFHRQPRCGYRGREFVCFKFRTMHHGSDEGPHRRYVEGLVTGKSDERNGDGVYKLVADNRVTRFGALLRRSSLDELPQLWNVLIGDMSLVGPRPPLPYEVALYDERQCRRLTVKPGITGLWQVSGRNQLSYREMCELDLEYINSWSLVLDLRILLRTFPVVFLNSGKAH